MDAMEEIVALEENDIWDIEPIPVGKKLVEYAVKLNPDGFLSCLKARMVAKGFSRHVVWIIMDFFGG